MPSAMPDATRVGRTALSVIDLAETVVFYRDVVGLTVVERRDGGATLGTDGTPLLELTAAPDAPPRPDSAAGLFHVAFRFPTRAALGAALERVRDGWTLDGASDHHVSEALYLSDPEGNGVELSRDRPRESWPHDADGSVEMKTLPLDIEDLVAASDGGTTAPPGTDVGHVHLEVTSLPDARAFYVDALGLNRRQERDAALFVAAGDYHHHVGLNTWNGRTDPAEGRGLEWIELLLPTADALAAVRKRLDDHGVAVTARDDGFEVTDPDGITLWLRAVD